MLIWCSRNISVEYCVAEYFFCVNSDTFFFSQYSLIKSSEEHYLFEIVLWKPILQLLVNLMHPFISDEFFIYPCSQHQCGPKLCKTPLTLIKWTKSNWKILKKCFLLCSTEEIRSYMFGMRMTTLYFRVNMPLNVSISLLPLPSISV